MFGGPWVSWEPNSTRAPQFLGDVEKDEHIRRPGNIQGRIEQAGWAGTDV